MPRSARHTCDTRCLPFSSRRLLREERKFVRVSALALIIAARVDLGSPWGSAPAADTAVRPAATSEVRHAALKPSAPPLYTIANAALRPRSQTTAHADAWARAILETRRMDYVAYRSAGPDGLAFTADDATALAGAGGNAFMTIAPAGPPTPEVLATRAQVHALAAQAQGQMSNPPRARAAPPPSRIRIAGRRWLAFARAHADDAARNAWRLALETGRRVPAPYLAATTTEDPAESEEDIIAREPVVGLIFDMGSVRAELHTIAAVITAPHPFEPPEAFRGQSFVPPGEEGTDPWGAPDRYERVDTYFRVVSAGPDGVWNSADDPLLNAYHRDVTDFQPHWRAGDTLTTGLAAITGQLDLPA